MALTYIKESGEDGVEVALCPACVGDSFWAGQPEGVTTRRGVTTTIRPWGGEDRECSYCPARHDDEADIENFNTEADDQHDAADER